MTLEKNHSGAVPEVLEGDITEIPVDVIVNAANEALLRGGGVWEPFTQSLGQS